MYGKWVIVELGEDIQCSVWVACTPSTPKDELQRLALNTLRSRLPEKKTGIAAGMEALQTIDDWNYSQGIGPRYEMEQKFKELYPEDAEKMGIQ